MTEGMDKHPVLFVGAGPGDPELITVKGKRALAAADVIIYAGSLVPDAVLQWARPGTVRINSASMHLQQIIDHMDLYHGRGKRVVRLHTGDPSLYGAIFEQMVELDNRSIPYRIVPGVTAAFAAAAVLGIEFTLPEITQTLILTRMAGRTPVPEIEGLSLLAAHRASMVIYLSIGMIEDVAEELKKAYGENAFGAVVYRASHPEEMVIVAPLSQLAGKVREAGIRKHALIVVGGVLGDYGNRPEVRSRLYDKDYFHEYRSGASG
jgi:precorrin-4/cobalt-precorrin-4 C11-methyltransferase